MELHKLHESTDSLEKGPAVGTGAQDVSRKSKLYVDLPAKAVQIAPESPAAPSPVVATALELNAMVAAMELQGEDSYSRAGLVHTAHAAPEEPEPYLEHEQTIELKPAAEPAAPSASHAQAMPAKVTRAEHAAPMQQPMQASSQMVACSHDPAAASTTCSGPARVNLAAKFQQQRTTPPAPTIAASLTPTPVEPAKPLEAAAVAAAAPSTITQKSAAQASPPAPQPASLPAAAAAARPAPPSTAPIPPAAAALAATAAVDPKGRTAAWVHGLADAGPRAADLEPSSTATRAADVLHEEHSRQQASSAVDRTFDEENPFQVLDESLRVLGEVEGLIRDSLGLPPDAPLDAEGADTLKRVPAALLEALEETLSVIMESRSEVQTIMSMSMASSLGNGHVTTPRRAGAAAQQQRQQSAGARRTYQLHHTSPAKALKPGAPPSGAPFASASSGSPYRHRQSPMRPMSGASHRVPSAQQPPWVDPNSSAPPAAYATTPTRPRSPGQQHSRQSPHPSPAAVHKAAAAAHRAAAAAAATAAQARGSDGGGSSRSAAGGQRKDYMYQRMERAAQDQEARALEEQRRRRDPHQPLYGSSSAAAAEWLEQQEQRKVAAEQRRIAQVQRDLAFIAQLRDRRAAADAAHEEVLAAAQHSIDTLRTHKAQTDAAARWLDYQDAMAEHSEMQCAMREASSWTAAQQQQY